MVWVSVLLFVRVFVSVRAVFRDPRCNDAGENGLLWTILTN